MAVFLDGVASLLSRLAQIASALKGASVTVGYSTEYAVYVHENLMAMHPVGQAKFLEGPYRSNSGRIKEIIREELEKGRSLGQALLIAGLFLQRKSQEVCPVDTGALRNSAFTVLE